jgi:hypothetical protein
MLSKSHAKAARTIKLEMENTITSTMADIRSAIAVTTPTTQWKKPAETQLQSDEVAMRAQRELGKGLGRTVGSMDKLNQMKAQRLSSSKPLRLRSTTPSNAPKAMAKDCPERSNHEQGDDRHLRTVQQHPHGSRFQAHCRKRPHHRAISSLFYFTIVPTICRDDFFA